MPEEAVLAPAFKRFSSEAQASAEALLRRVPEIAPLLLARSGESVKVVLPPGAKQEQKLKR
jgi:hypothetical protein